MLSPQHKSFKGIQKPFRCSKYAHSTLDNGNMLQHTRHPELVTYQLETPQTKSLQLIESHLGHETLEIKHTDEKQHIEKRTKRPKSYMSKRINAFIAFRSYYSRQVNDYDEQISISRFLSVAWKNENKELWRSYALLYNSSNSNIPFVDWLQTKGPKIRIVHQQSRSPLYPGTSYSAQEIKLKMFF